MWWSILVVSPLAGRQMYSGASFISITILRLYHYLIRRRLYISTEIYNCLFFVLHYLGIY